MVREFSMMQAQTKSCRTQIVGKATRSNVPHTGADTCHHAINKKVRTVLGMQLFLNFTDAIMTKGRPMHLKHGNYAGSMLRNFGTKRHVLTLRERCENCECSAPHTSSLGDLSRPHPRSQALPHSL
jgi:hypothetical protein